MSRCALDRRALGLSELHQISCRGSTAVPRPRTRRSFLKCRSCHINGAPCIGSSRSRVRQRSSRNLTYMSRLTSDVDFDDNPFHFARSHNTRQKRTISKIPIRNAYTKAAVPNHLIDPSQCIPSHQNHKTQRQKLPQNQARAQKCF